MKKHDLIFDMETADPDDAMTLCLLANHNHITLRAVTVTPGTDEQIGMVKHILKITGHDLPVGSKAQGRYPNIYLHSCRPGQDGEGAHGSAISEALCNSDHQGFSSGESVEA